MATRAPELLNALDLLAEQHTYVDRLFEQIARGDNRLAAFTELAGNLAAHATVEEKLFYPRVMSDQTRDLLHESAEDHLAIKRVLAELLTMDLNSDEFTAKVSVLKEQVSHHAHEEEEQKLFPLLRKKMGVDELAELGNELLAMFEAVIKVSPRPRVPGETHEAAPLPVTALLPSSATTRGRYTARR